MHILKLCVLLYLLHHVAGALPLAEFYFYIFFYLYVLLCTHLHAAGYLKDWDRITHPGPGSLVPWTAEINLK